MVSAIQYYGMLSFELSSNTQVKVFCQEWSGTWLFLRDLGNALFIADVSKGNLAHSIFPLQGKTMRV